MPDAELQGGKCTWCHKAPRLISKRPDLSEVWKCACGGIVQEKKPGEGPGGDKRCFRCGVTAVHQRNEVCAKCRDLSPTASPLRKNLTITLEDIAQENLRLLAEQQELLRREIDFANPEGSEQTKFNPVQAGEVMRLSRAIAALVKEVRALEKERGEAADELGYEEKRQLLVEFYKLMPVEHQREMLKQLTQVYNDEKKVG